MLHKAEISTGHSLNDGLWHTVSLSTRGLQISLALDNEPSSMMEVNAQIDSGDNYFFGGCPNILNELGCKNPTQVFQGCMRLIFINNQPMNLLHVQQGLLGNYSDLQIDLCGIKDRCLPNYCEHGGQCSQSWNTFYCDCSGTGYTGATCHNSIYEPSCEAYRQIGSTSGYFSIDSDGSGPLGPTLVYCNITDLNPIENLWKELKTAVHKRSPSNLTELELFCKEEWARISVSRCAKLIETYPKRLAAVIAAKEDKVWTIIHHNNSEPARVQGSSLQKPYFMQFNYSMSEEQLEAMVNGAEQWFFTFFSITPSHTVKLVGEMKKKSVQFYKRTNMLAESAVLLQESLCFLVKNVYMWLFFLIMIMNGTPFSWWVGRTGEKHTYWSGSMPGVQQCSCSLLENCIDMNYFCNCDADREEWANDTGLLSYKDHLPVNKIVIGDTSRTGSEATYRVGPLCCYGDRNFWNAASFYQESSYLHFPTFHAELSADISFYFKTTAENGVFLENLGIKDFIRIELRSPSTVVFSFDVGNGPVDLVVTSSVPLNDKQWHYVRVERNIKEVLLQVNQLPIRYHEAPSEGHFRLQLSSQLFVGGTPSRQKGFLGCIRALTLNGLTLDLEERARMIPGVSSGCPGYCSSYGSRCHNRGKCIEKKNGYSCDCTHSAYEGPFCKKEVSVFFEAGSSVTYMFQEPFSVVQNKSGQSSAVYAEISKSRENIAFSFLTTRTPAMLFTISTYYQQYMAIILAQNGMNYERYLLKILTGESCIPKLLPPDQNCRNLIPYFDFPKKNLFIFFVQSSNHKYPHKFVCPQCLSLHTLQVQNYITILLKQISKNLGNVSACIFFPGSLQIWYQLNKEKKTDTFFPKITNFADGQLHWVRIHREGKDVNIQFFFVEKKDGELRPCIDYRGLNEMTVKNLYPLLLITVALESINGNTIFSKLDNSSSLRFFSRKLLPTEINCDVENWELLAVKLAREEWKHWLEGAQRPFVIYSDHKNLEYLQSAKRLNSRQARIDQGVNTKYSLSSDAELNAIKSLTLGKVTSSAIEDEDVALAGVKGFVGCLSSVQFNQVAPLKAALHRHDSSLVSVKGRLTESNCGAKSMADLNTFTTTHSLSGMFLCSNLTLFRKIRYTSRKSKFCGFVLNSFVLL
ncbi:CNTP5 protein, partial [Atractosteus spatula]|nr:CNTP5 protein [Atractosteus spatula]